MVKRGLNVRQTEELVRRLLGLRQQEQRPAREMAPEIRALEAQFREALGTKVNLTRKGAGGRIVIHFYSEEELDALYERIIGDV